MANAKKVTTANAAQTKVLNDTALNISQKMRALAAQGVSTGDISRLMNKRFQHVRNVLTAKPKKA